METLTSATIPTDSGSDSDFTDSGTGDRSQDRGAARLPLRRPFQDRMLAGVAAGLADYLGIDLTLVRIGFVVLTVIGGMGIPLYLAGLLLIPDEGSDSSIASQIIQSLQR
jgi:phage shock protein PspC (stress-responsive transcriptional regulator)